MNELILPYGPAPAISFIVHEAAMYLLLVLCLLHAGRRGGPYLYFLLGAVLFGLLLEYVNVNAQIGYWYGQFWLMLGPAPEAGQIAENIPVNIGVGWGIIIYTARLYSDSVGLRPLWVRPFLDALLALNIDLSMDTVAYRLNMWHWGWEFQRGQPDPLTSEWFGVPYANFWAWLLVVCFYSAWGRLLIDRPAQSGRFRGLRLFGGMVLTIALAQAALFLFITYLPPAVLGIIDAVLPHFRRPYFILSLITIVLFLSLTLYGYKRRQFPRKQDSAAIIWLVPTYFHLYFLGWLFLAGFYREGGWLTAVSILNASIGLAIHMLARETNKPIGDFTGGCRLP